MKKNNVATFVLLILTLVTLSACDMFYESEDEKNSTFLIPSGSTINEAVFYVMDEWYLWEDTLPESIDPSSYESPQDLMSSLRYDDLDSWSYVTTIESYDQYYEEGSYIGFGFGMTWRDDDRLFVSYVYADSPAKKAGITRGYEIVSIDDVPVLGLESINAALGDDELGVTRDFVFNDTKGEVKQLSLSKDEVSMNTVLHSQVIESGSKKVGYIVFKAFIVKSIAELQTAFNKFEDEAIDELVVDLRYNGGGRLNVALYLASLIVPTASKDAVFVHYTHNKNRSNENTTSHFDKNNSLNLERVVFITNNNSASASEVVINSLSPYMDVYLVGEATHGKPVGMYVFEHDGYAIAPISFRLENGDGYSDYYGGMPVDGAVSDEIAYDFGDTQEPCLKESLSFLQTGAFSTSRSMVKPIFSKRELRSNRVVREDYSF